MAENPDLEKAYKALIAKQAPYSLLWHYYDGDHPLEYSTARLRKIFRNIKSKFIQNWCGVIVDSIVERLELTSVAVTDNKALSKELTDLWQSTELDLDEEDVHRAALVTGEAFVIAWRNDEDEHVEAYYVSSDCVCVQYDPDNPRKKLWAAKIWTEEDGFRRINLYYPDRFERYRTSKAGVPRSYKSFVMMDAAPLVNAMGKVPVFHFQRERRACISELENITPLQAAINKLLADMMVSAECGAYLQRYIISNTDDDLSKTLANIPGSIWQIPAGDEAGQAASVGSLSATPLQNFLDAIDDLVNAVSAISRTPHHYFFGKGADLSGEALMALEAPLNKKCATYIKRFTSVWRQLAAFLLELAGTPVEPNSIVVTFAKPETVQPKTQAEIRQLSSEEKLPLVTALRREGWSEEELQQLATDKADEEAQKQTTLALAMVEAQRRFAQGEGEEPEETEEEDGEVNRG
ncbi:MAG TPA: phage portal protein [Anaerolineae bacterium]|nr:phage portal protein [Anaerolineae bacterium]HUW13380.1 phage portal protein [Anaerolineae bacterium]